MSLEHCAGESVEAFLSEILGGTSSWTVVTLDCGGETVEGLLELPKKPFAIPSQVWRAL